MGENTKIEWAHHTFNPWVGCTKVSPACDHCYAEAWARRTGNGHLWSGERRRTTDANWHNPVKWNRKAEALGIRYRVFCASLADVFDNQVEDGWRSDLFALIEDTPHLDWLLLTKRPQNITKMIWPKWDNGLPRNIWLGTTTENQAEADRRIPHLLAAPAAKRFLSIEPLLGPVDLCFVEAGSPEGRAMGIKLDVLRPPRGVDWVIVGGESGPGARPMHPDWARSLRDQCQTAEVPFFFKQWGNWRPPVNDFEAGRLLPANTEHFPKLPEVHLFEGGAAMLKVNKKGAAGRLLDGRTWDEVPR